LFNVLSVKRGFTNAPDEVSAVNEITAQINQENINLVLFFSSPKYNFSTIASLMKKAFPNTKVVGSTSGTEIIPGRNVDNSVIAISISASDFNVEVAIMKDIKTRAMLYKRDLMNAFEKIGLSLNDPLYHKKGFALTLIDGVSGAEEKVLSVISSFIKSEEFTLIGASAADGYDFKKVYLSYNGEVYENAAIVIFVKTSHPFYAYKENIFTPYGKDMVVTKIDMNSKIVYEIDHMPATQAYAKALGVEGISNEELFKYFKSNPIGRKYGDRIMVVSPYQIFEDGSIQCYAQILPNSVINILQAVDPLEVVKDTVADVRSNISNIKAIIVFNCILRTLQFNEEKITDRYFSELCKLGGEVIGISCYGEQFGKYHVNQTLTLLALGE
jgi:hypothetical protein